MSNNLVFAGKWQLYDSENFEDFMAAVGANFLIRKMAANSKPQMEIEQSEAGEFNIRLFSMFVNKVTKFKVGQSFEEKQQSGDIMKITPSWDNSKLVMNFEPVVEGKGKTQKHTREVEGDKLTLTLEIGDVTAKRFFKKQS